MNKTDSMPLSIKNIGYIINYNDVKSYYQVDYNKIELIDIILNKRVKNNLLLIGEPGTDKTTLIEIYAKMNKNLNVFFVNTGRLIAGCKYRGEFEEKVENLIRYSEEKGYILFFDEIHALIDLGKAEGGISITDILKPYLTKPNFKCIGTTTVEESKLLLKDKAFNRRFSTLKLKEINNNQLIDIKNDFLKSYSNKIEIDDNTINEVIQKLDNELNELYFPDKLIDFLDFLMSYINIKNEYEIYKVLDTYINIMKV